jgi:glycosyltransferase involved in cell wall biosynthesis
MSAREGRVRLALLTEIPAPYRIPLFNALAERVDLRVLFLAHADPRRSFYEQHAEEWRFEHEFLRGFELRRGGRWVVLSLGALRALHRFRPDAVGVGGWNQPAFWLARAYARARCVPLLVWVESTTHDARSESRVLESAKRAMIRRAAGFFVPGSAARAYVRSFGISDERIAVAPNAVDERIFGPAAVDRRGRRTCTFLYVGRLDADKGLEVLLRAFANVPGELVLVGSGDEEGRLREQADERVAFRGALGRDALPAEYAAADVFVLPSRSEPWGMVLNEAAAAGLPLVASEGVGAADDLIEEGINGFRVPVGDAEALARALRRLAGDEGLRLSAGARSLELARAFSPAVWADAVAGLAERTSRLG